MQINSLTPRLVVADPDGAIEFLQRALDAEEDERFEQDGVVVHAGVRIGEFGLSLSAEVPNGDGCRRPRSAAPQSSSHSTSTTLIRSPIA